MSTKGTAFVQVCGDVEARSRDLEEALGELKINMGTIAEGRADAMGVLGGQVSLAAELDRTGFFEEIRESNAAGKRAREAMQRAFRALWNLGCRPSDEGPTAGTSSDTE